MRALRFGGAAILPPRLDWWQALSACDEGHIRVDPPAEAYRAVGEWWRLRLQDLLDGR
ncbi:MAG: hypothetical protein KTR31_30485 [Myxococcales bacterium]|nr:hypothetical protein [Myxococcales bacterium]